MKNWERSIVPGGLVLAGVVFLFAAVKPVLSELPLNVTFLLIGIVAAVAGVALWRRAGASCDQ